MNIGRCLQRLPGESPVISYVAKERVETEGDVTLGKYALPGDGWWLRRVALEDGSHETLIQMPDGSEDYVWTAQGGVLTVDGSRVLYWDGQGVEQPRSAWREVTDLAEQGLKELSRLALSPDGSKLAVVLGSLEPYGGTAGSLGCRFEQAFLLHPFAVEFREVALTGIGQQGDHQSVVAESPSHLTSPLGRR